VSARNPSPRLLRARLNERIARAAQYPVAMIVAPAGFGKSVALRDYLETARIEAVRYDVRREDRTLLAFVRGLSEALEPVAPAAIGAFSEIQSRLLSSTDPVRDASDWMSEHLRRTICTIVVDDFHYAASDEGTTQFLAEMVERTAGRIHWVIATRSDAGLPVATWIAYERMELPINENDLRFTREEALAAAEGALGESALEEVETLRQLVGGWPVALTFALRTRPHVADLRDVSTGTRDMVYRYLAEQAYGGLQPAERELLLRTCLLPEFDVDLLASGGVDAEGFERLRRTVTFVTEIAPGRYRYHDLFKDFLEAQIRRQGTREWARAVREAGDLLVQAGEEANALRVYLRAPDAGAVLPIVDRHGFALLERGEAALLSAALEAVEESELGQSAAALGIAATLDANHGHFTRARARFDAAIAAAGDTELHLQLVHRYALELVRRGEDAISLLEAHVGNDDGSASVRARIRGTLATAYERSGRAAEAQTTIDEALVLLHRFADPDTAARVYQQAAYIYQFSPQRDMARSYALLAVELAEANALYEIAARAYSVLYALAYDEGDAIATLGILDKLSESARKSGSVQLRLFGLLATYEIEVERGDEQTLGQLDERMRSEQRAFEENRAVLALTRAESLLPALAMRAAWNGDFAGALAYSRESLQHPLSNERRAERSAEAAVYAIAAGEDDAARELLAAAADADGYVSERRVLYMRILLAVAELLRNHTAGAQRALSDAERRLASASAPLQAFARAVRAIYRVQLGETESAAVTAALERMRSSHYGGMARVLEALPFQAADAVQGGLPSLTAAERTILRLLARGSSTKEIAAGTGRSPHTVDTHIRAICRKLNCSGRREAVALAISTGWVDLQSVGG
jgi:LuxR family maltose regulon positive regulatory protein